MNKNRKLNEYQLSMIYKHTSKEWIGKGWFVKTNIKDKHIAKSNVNNVMDEVFSTFNYHDKKTLKEPNNYYKMTCQDGYLNTVEELLKKENEKITIKYKPLTLIRLYIPIKDENTNDQLENIAEQFLIYYVDDVNERKRTNKKQEGITYLDLETMKSYTSIYIKKHNGNYPERSEVFLIISNIQKGKNLKLASVYDVRYALKNAYEKIIGEIDYFDPKNKNKKEL